MSLRSARELLCLRNDDHCHEDMIALVLRDLSGSIYLDGIPDYRFKTVRSSIRGLAWGSAAYQGGEGYYDAQRAWRPLEPTTGGGGRGVITFDVEAFMAEHPSQAHTLPEGDESGGAQWTCAVKEWGSWSSRATREANRSEDAGHPATSPSGAPDGPAEEWWKAVKRDPVVREVVGKRLRAMKSPRDLTEEDVVLLGTRVERPKGDPIKLPQEAQPEGVKLGSSDGGPRPPLFDFSDCAECVIGAAWFIPPVWDTPRTPRLVCTNKQAWLDRQSMAMQQWTGWKETQETQDHEVDAMAINRLKMAHPLDAAVLVETMIGWFREPKPVRPLANAFYMEERTRYNYWPAGALEFAALTALNLPDPGRGWRVENRWRKDVQEWLETMAAGSGDFDWSLALACLQVWQAREVLGLGADIWATVAAATVADTRSQGVEEKPGDCPSAEWEL